MTSDKLVIAFSCIGRRVQLVRHFRQACSRLGVQAHFIGMDADPAKASAGWFCDEEVVLPHGGAPDFDRALLDVVAQKKIHMLIPLADPDLLAISRIREDVRALGCLPAYCGARTMHISMDKLETYRFLHENNILTPHTLLLSDALASRRQSLPLFIKPRRGSAGKDTLAIRTWALPDFIASQVDQFVCQELLIGQEVTVDVFIDQLGQPHCAVPRLRLEVRGGEVMKSMVRVDAAMEAQVCFIAKTLPDAFGVINVQGFIQPDGQVAWTEINARFGGGSPLAIEAGARYPDLLIAGLLGRPLEYPAAIRDGMTMLRFDDAVYVDGGTVRRGSDVVSEALASSAQPATSNIE